MIPSSKIRNVRNLVIKQKEFIRNYHNNSDQPTTYNQPTVAKITNNSGFIQISDTTAQLKSWKEIPGPSSLPIIGALQHFLPGGSLVGLDEFDLFNQLYHTYGPIVRMDSTLNRPAHIIVYDPESVSQVLRGEVLPIRPGFGSLSYYRKRYKQRTEKIMMTGLITDHGEVWKELRSAVNPIFMQPKTIRLYTTAIDEVAKDMIKRLKMIRDNKNMLQGNIQREMNTWALESIGVVGLGTRLNCFNDNLPKDSPERRFVEYVHKFFEVTAKLDLKPNMWKYFSTPTFQQSMKVYEEVENLAKYFITKSKRELEENKGKCDEEKGILEKLLEINEEYAYIMAIDLVIAGVDTTANTIMTTLYLLATNPHKQERLREQIATKHEKKPYLSACIKESLRLIPTVPNNVRLTTKNYNILGYDIPKHMILKFPHHNMSLMEKHYPSANEFIPERWLVEKDHPLYHGNANSFTSSPFGFGARSCIGRRIAALELETFLTRIIENFHVDWFGDYAKIGQSFINYIKEPHNFIFKDV